MRKYTVLSCLIMSVAILGGCVHNKQESDPATAFLNHALRRLYQDVTAGKRETDIIGQKLDLLLMLRFCSEKHILFEDTRVVVDGDTKYYFVTWKYDPAVVELIHGKENVRCRVKGTILEVCRGNTTPSMPYIVARLESIDLQ